MSKAARKAVERLMKDRVRIDRPPSGPGTVNLGTLAVDRGLPTRIYSGKAMYGDRLSGHTREEGFADKREHVGQIRLPVDDAADVRVGDEVFWLEGPLRSQTWEVVADKRQTHEVSARFEILKKPSEVMRS